MVVFRYRIPKAPLHQTLVFLLRITKYWNKMPENIVNAPSINSFKNRLDKH
jgi:hypothetical protein